MQPYILNISVLARYSSSDIPSALSQMRFAFVVNLIPIIQLHKLFSHKYGWSFCLHFVALEWLQGLRSFDFAQYFFWHFSLSHQIQADWLLPWAGTVSFHLHSQLHEEESFACHTQVLGLMFQLLLGMDVKLSSEILLFVIHISSEWQLVLLLSFEFIFEVEIHLLKKKWGDYIGYMKWVLKLVLPLFIFSFIGSFKFMGLSSLQGVWRNVLSLEY